MYVCFIIAFANKNSKHEFPPCGNSVLFVMPQKDAERIDLLHIRHDIKRKSHLSKLNLVDPFQLELVTLELFFIRPNIPYYSKNRQMRNYIKVKNSRFNP